jgi:hypothetical protein
MPKNKNTNSADQKIPGENRAIDTLVVLFCLVGMSVCLWFFRQDLYQTLSRLSVKPVGTVILKRRIAQRRSENRVLWDNLQKTAPVYAGDFIRTAERSGAVITLIDDDTVTTLEENTIIQIGVVSKTGESRINLFDGSASVSTGSGGTVFTSGNDTLVLAAGSTAVAAAGNGGFAFRVDEGSAIFIGPEGTAETFRAGEGSVPAGFSGLVISDPAREVLQENAGSPTSDRPAAVETADATPAPAGPRLIVPTDGEVFPGNNGRGEMNFRWVAGDDDQTALYIFELADNPAMENAIVTMRVSGKRIALPEPGKGRWYWRVTPVYYAKNSTATPPAVAAFSIGETVPTVHSDVPTTVPVAETGRRPADFEQAGQIATPPSARNVVEQNAAAQSTGVSRNETVSQSTAQSGASRNETVSQSTAQSGVSRNETVSQSTTQSTGASRNEIVSQSTTQSDVRIVAENTVQNNAQSSAQNVVLQIAEPLLPPGRLRPEDGYVLGTTQLRANRNITFRWDPVPGTTGYVFSLYRETDGLRQRIDTVELQATDYVFNKLSLLERGGFVWTVEALRKGNDGTVEQGNTAESRFIVDLPPLERYELPEIGNMYGN